MEGRSYISSGRGWLKNNYIILMIVILAAGVRIHHSFHYLLSDEVFNLISIEELAKNKGFDPYFFKHPPLYTLFSALLYLIISPSPGISSYLSIAFSVLSFIPFYLMVEMLAGKRTALWASLFLAMMPANFHYSTWIKQESMLLFFFLWGVYFYIRSRYVLSGIAIGTALLVKEFALLFFPLSFLITLISRKGSGLFSDWSDWAITIVMSLVISAWWYYLFGYLFYLIAGEALIGAYAIEMIWHKPWWFFLRNLPFDLSYPIFIFFLAGMVYLIKEFRKTGFDCNFWLFISWICVIYIPVSFLHMKTPWFIYLATPPMAVAAAFGMIRLFDLLKSDKTRLVGYLLVILSLVVSVLKFDYLSYNEYVSDFKITETIKTDAKELHGKSWKDMVRKKKIWEKKLQGTDKVCFLEYNPLLQYLMGLQNEQVLRIRVSYFMSLDKNEIFKFSKDNNISSFLLNSESLAYSDKNLADMISLWGEPEKVDHWLIFRTANLKS